MSAKQCQDPCLGPPADSINLYWKCVSNSFYPYRQIDNAYLNRVIMVHSQNLGNRWGPEFSFLSGASYMLLVVKQRSSQFSFLHIPRIVRETWE